MGRFSKSIEEKKVEQSEPVKTEKQPVPTPSTEKEAKPATKAEPTKKEVTVEKKEAQKKDAPEAAKKELYNKRLSVDISNAQWAKLLLLQAEDGKKPSVRIRELIDSI